MHVTSARRLDDGLVEREFTLGDISGVLWAPTSTAAPAPLICVPAGTRSSVDVPVPFLPRTTSASPLPGGH